MIKNSNGRSRSIRTRSELEKMLRADLARLTPDEREAAELMIKELMERHENSDRPKIIDVIGKVDYKTTPVDIKTFVMDPYYLGNTCDNLYPILLKDLEEMFSGGYHEAILTGCIELDAIIQSSNGSLKTIREWIGTSGSVVGFSASGPVHATTGQAKHSGVLPVMRMLLANGMEQRLTPDHRVMTWRGEYKWVSASDLSVGDLVVTAKSIKTTPDSSLTQAEAESLAKQSTLDSVPDSVCRSHNKAVSAFVNQVLSNGSVASHSERFIRQMQLLLLRLGIRSKIAKSDAWKLSVEAKQNGHSDYSLERVDEIEPAGEMEVGDICDVAGVESFISNGIYSHNSIGWGKCLRSDNSYVTDCITGERKTMKEWIGTTPRVPTLLENGKIGTAMASRVWRSGVKKCIKMEVASGQWIEASKDHPILTPTGWKRLDKLKVGDLVALAKKCPEPKIPYEMMDEEVIAAGLLIADGCNLSRGKSNYKKSNERIVALFQDCVSKVPGFKGFGTIRPSSAWDVPCRGITKWIVKNDLNHLSKLKRIPSKMFGLSNRQLALLIRAIWTDGNVYTKAPHKIEILLASEGLIDDLQEALKRFSIVSRKTFAPKGIKSRGKKYNAWRLQIADAHNIKKFLTDVGPLFGYEEKCDELLAIVNDKGITKTGLSPVTQKDLREIKNSVESKSGWGKYLNQHTTSLVTTSKLEEIVKRYKYDGPLAKFVDMEVNWERIRSLEDTGRHEVADLTVPATKNAVANGFVVHNTHLATIGTCRVLYELSCMKDPAKSFGLSKGSNIALVCTSVNETLAVKVVFEAIASKLKASPYFEDHFPMEDTKKEIRFPNGVMISAKASTDTSALGLNAISALMDESNFLPKTAKEQQAGVVDRAETIYNTIQRRMKSRFERSGKLPGMIFVVSSKNTTDDFTAKRVREAKNDPSVFVRDYALWTTKPKEYYSAKKFWVLGGNATVPSKIMTDEEHEKMKDAVPDGVTLVHVPEDFRSAFEQDLEGSLRDLAGVATVAVNPFIHRREKIIEAIDPNLSHPFSVQVYDPSKGGTFEWHRMVQETQERDTRGVGHQKILRPILNPRAPRRIHIDPSYRKDATGFCMAHISGWKDVMRRSEDGREYAERAPIFTVDVLLRIVPPVGGELVLGDIRHIIYDIAARGYIITGVTMDTWGGPDSVQQLTQRGYNASFLSVDTTTDPYDNLKSALYENRVHYYNYQPLIEELQQLERHITPKRVKVDHPVKGRKDVADALAAVCHALATGQSLQPVPMMKGLSVTGDAWMEEQRHAYLAGNQSASVNTDADAQNATSPLPFLVGGNDGNGTGWDPNGGGGWSNF